MGEERDEAAECEEAETGPPKLWQGGKRECRGFRAADIRQEQKYGGVSAECSQGMWYTGLCMLCILSIMLSVHK